MRTPKQQLAFIFFSTLLAAFSLGSIITFTDPAASSFLTFFFLYLSIFLTSLGMLVMLGLGLRQWLWPKIFVLDLGHSFRQALLISVLITASFWLASQGLLYWWVEGSLILFLLSIETFYNLKI